MGMKHASNEVTLQGEFAKATMDKTILQVFKMILLSTQNIVFTLQFGLSIPIAQPSGCVSRATLTHIIWRP